MPTSRSTLLALAGLASLIAVPAAHADSGRFAVFKVQVEGKQVTDWTFEEPDGNWGCGAGAGAGSGQETLVYRSRTKPVRVQLTLSSKRGRPYLSHAAAKRWRETSVDVPLNYTYSRTGSREKNMVDNGACVRRASWRTDMCGQEVTARGGIELGFWKKDFRMSGGTDDPRRPGWNARPDRDLLNLVGLDDPRWAGDGWNRVTDGCPTSPYGLHDIDTPIWAFATAYDRRFFNGRKQHKVRFRQTVEDKTPLINGGSAANTTKITTTVTFTRVG